MQAPIPIFINLPDRIAFWESNEVGLFMGVWLMCLMIDQFCLGLLMGVLVVKLRKRLQRSPSGDLTKIGLYWFTPFSPVLFKSLPPSYVREMLG